MGDSRENLAWLRARMPAIFFVTLREEPEKLATLCMGLRREAVQLLEVREISFAEISHSYAPVPGADRELIPRQ